ncbi:MAG TPA: aminotransferase class I/II-fold pyridoxal phosphate-dependent enzyme [Nitrososphaeraceae archaeon]|nr:aminotransferase class I/II-fold pyridoxal phosphate-dependent enzyme [Nitrososphaeraceae archaeon]
MKVSERTAGVEYAIRDIIMHAREYEKKNCKNVIYLNIGDPVQYDFPTPEHIKNALIKAVQNNENYYTASEGLPELRQAIVEKEKGKGFDVTENDVLVTNGVSEALDMTLASVVSPNDEILMPGPHYPPYKSYVKFYGGKPVEFKIHPDGKPDIDDLKSKITSKTSAICLISPNNPTGEVFSYNNLKDIVDVAAQHDLYIICDEIYDKIVFDETFSGIGRVSKDLPVILLNGFSKVYLMTGWRCGYMCINSSSPKLDDFRANVPKLARVRIAANLPVQKAAVEALRGPQDHIGQMVHKLKNRRNYIVKRLNSMPRVSSTLPKGAFYVFPKINLDGRWKNDLEFVIDLLNNTGVLTVHGSGFGSTFGSDHFRIVYLANEELLEQAMDKLERFLAA